MLQYSRSLKVLPEKFVPEAGTSATSGPAIVEAYCQRALILLKNERFDAALADCKRAIDINPKHTDANILWKSALEREIPPEPVAEPIAEVTPPPAKAKPVVKKVKKVVKKVKRRKDVTVTPIPVVKPKEVSQEEPTIIFGETEPQKEIILEEKPPEAVPPPTGPEKTKKVAAAEPVPEEKPPAEPEPDITLEPEEAAHAITLETEAEIETPAEPEPDITLEPEKAAPVITLETEAEIEPPAEPEPDITLESEEAAPAITLETEAEIEPPVAEAGPAVEMVQEITEDTEAVSEPFPEKDITVEEQLSVEEQPSIESVKPEKAEPDVKLETEAEIAPTHGPEISMEVEEEISVVREPLPDEEQGPLIPEGELVAPKPPGEPLLEEFDREKLREFEEGEAGAGDSEWTRFAEKQGLELPDSKIDMNVLPASAHGLRETLSDLRQAEAYNLQGENQINKNLYNHAIKDFSKALAINPNYVDALINRGSAYTQLGRFNDALMDFNHALKFEKKDAELYNKRGEVFIQNNMHDQAIKDFTAAVVLNPLFSDAYLNRGRAYSEKGMPEEAMNDFNQAIKADSDHSFGFVDRAAPSIHKDMDEESSGNKEKALQFIQLGLADLKSDKFTEAAENFTQAINLTPSNAEGYINRGRAYIKLDKVDEAMADFNQGVIFDPLNATLYYWRAQAWKAKDDQFNVTEDLKLSCEMGYEPACFEYRKLKSKSK